jgi:hypothetical protein
MAARHSHLFITQAIEIVHAFVANRKAAAVL